VPSGSKEPRQCNDLFSVSIDLVSDTNEYRQFTFFNNAMSSVDA